MTIAIAAIVGMSALGIAIMALRAWIDVRCARIEAETRYWEERL